MSTNRDVDRIVRSWLQEGTTVLPDRVLDAVLDQLPATPQGRRSPVWRFLTMNSYARLAVAAAAIVLVAIVALTLIPGLNIGGPTATPTPAPTASASAQAGTPLGAVTAGKTQTTVAFKAPFTWYVPNDGWLFGGETAVSFDVHINPANVHGLTLYTDVQLYKDPCDATKGFAAVGATPVALATAIAALPGATTSAVTAVTIDGYAGSQVDFTVAPPTPGCSATGRVSLLAAGPTFIDRFYTGVSLRLSIIDVKGTRVVFETWTQGAAAVDADFATVKQVIDSIHFL